MYCNKSVPFAYAFNNHMVKGTLSRMMIYPVMTGIFNALLTKLSRDTIKLQFPKLNHFNKTSTLHSLCTASLWKSLQGQGLSREEYKQDKLDFRHSL